MEKKNTVVLTIIAVATLLVTVAGATFAYFTATNNVEATSAVEVTTSSLSSITSTATNCTMTVEATDMLAANGRSDGSAYKEETCYIDITGTHPANSSSSEVCEYTLSYTPTSPLTYKSTGAVNAAKKEVILEGAATTTGTYASSTGVTEFSVNASNTEFELYDVSTQTALFPLVSGQPGKATFTYGGPTPSDQVTEATVSTVRWTFHLKFFNYDFDQNILGGKTFGGSISVDGFNCRAISN